MKLVYLETGSPTWTRTRDRTVNSRVLYQTELSRNELERAPRIELGKKAWKANVLPDKLCPLKLEGRAGFEPAVS